MMIHSRERAAALESGQAPRFMRGRHPLVQAGIAWLVLNVPQWSTPRMRTESRFWPGVPLFPGGGIHEPAAECTCQF